MAGQRRREERRPLLLPRRRFVRVLAAHDAFRLAGRAQDLHVRVAVLRLRDPVRGAHVGRRDELRDVRVAPHEIVGRPQFRPHLPVVGRALGRPDDLAHVLVDERIRVGQREEAVDAAGRDRSRAGLRIEVVDPEVGQLQPVLGEQLAERHFPRPAAIERDALALEVDDRLRGRAGRHDQIRIAADAARHDQARARARRVDDD